jgi:hypothetical protein
VVALRDEEVAQRAILHARDGVDVGRAGGHGLGMLASPGR